MLKLCDENEAEMCNVLALDLRRSRQEALVNEIEQMRNDLRSLLMNMEDYASPEKVVTIV